MPLIYLETETLIFSETIAPLTRACVGRAAVYNTPTPVRVGHSSVLNTPTRAHVGIAAVLNVMSRATPGTAIVLGTHTTAHMGRAAIKNTLAAVHAGRSAVRKLFTAVMQRGVAAVDMAVTGKRVLGRHRIANDTVEGYVVYVGRGAMPDFTQPPNAFNPTLPVSFAVTPPVTGTLVLWVVTRKRNKYGIESQNTQPHYINIDTDGNEVLGVVSTPIISGVVSVEDEYFRVFLSYPGYATDTDRADTWRVYVGVGAPPVPGVDTPVATGTITGTGGAVRVGPYPTGGIDYYFAATVYRTEDTTESDAATFELDLPVDPSPPVALNGTSINEEE